MLEGLALEGLRETSGLVDDMESSGWTKHVSGEFLHGDPTSTPPDKMARWTLPQIRHITPGRSSDRLNVKHKSHGNSSAGFGSV